MGVSVCACVFAEMGGQAHIIICVCVCAMRKYCGCEHTRGMRLRTKFIVRNFNTRNGCALAHTHTHIFGRRLRKCRSTFAVCVCVVCVCVQTGRPVGGTFGGRLAAAVQIVGVRNIAMISSFLSLSLSLSSSGLPGGVGRMPSKACVYNFAYCVFGVWMWCCYAIAYLSGLQAH